MRMDKTFVPFLWRGSEFRVVLDLGLSSTRAERKSESVLEGEGDHLGCLGGGEDSLFVGLVGVVASRQVTHARDSILPIQNGLRILDKLGN